MADNLIADSGDNLGPAFATDDIDGIHYPRSKVVWGPDGTANDTDNAAGKRLPVNIAETIALPVTDNGGALTIDDGGASLTVDGTVTVVQATATNLKVDASTVAVPVTDNGETLSIDDGAGSITVDGVVAISGTLTVNTHAVTNAGTFAVQASQSGTWDVGTVTALTAITNALPAGTNAIGKLVANSGVDIGDVDVLSILPGVGATNLGKAEDAVHTTGDVGVMALTVRQDTPAALGGTDMDYQPLVTDSTGRLHVNVGNTVTVGSHAVTNAGTFATQAAQSGTWNIGTLTTLTNVVHVDDNGATLSVDDGGGTLTVDGAVTITGTVAVTQSGTWDEIGINDSGNSITVDNAQLSVVGTGTEATALRVTIATDSTGVLSIDDNGGSLTVDGTVAVTNGGLTELAAAINASSQMDVNIAASAATLTVASHAVTNAGTFVIQENGAALTALQQIDNPVVVDDAAFTPATTSVMMAGFEFDDATPDSVNEGDAGAARMSANRNIYTTLRDAAGNERGANVNASSQLAVSVDNTVTVASHAVTNAGTFATQAAIAGDVAHDTADSGNPSKMGAKASTGLSALTLVADNDRTNLFAGVDGVLIVRENCNLEDIVGGVAAITDGSSTTVIAASGAGIRTYVTDVTICNSSATYVNVDIRDGTAGAVLWTFPAPPTSGCVYRFASPLRSTANTIVAADPSAAASTVTVSLRGFKSKV